MGKTIVIPRLAAIRNAIDTVNHVAASCKSFKIGKTHNISDRIAEPDYAGLYTNHEQLFSSPSKELISYVEAIFIDACLEALPEQCDNKKDGDDSYSDQMKDSDMYYVYVVWR